MGRDATCRVSGVALVPRLITAMRDVAQTLRMDTQAPIPDSDSTKQRLNLGFLVIVLLVFSAITLLSPSLITTWFQWPLILGVVFLFKEIQSRLWPKYFPRVLWTRRRIFALTGFIAVVALANFLFSFLQTLIGAFPTTLLTIALFLFWFFKWGLSETPASQSDLKK